MIVPNYFENLKVLHQGTMPNRSYYIPASEQRNDLVENREKSDRFQLLNGNWKFQYFESVHELKEEFYREDYNSNTWDWIPVPSVWQNYGYDHHQYTNWRYPFPFDPPYLPYENPCGAYIHTFSYVSDDDAPTVFLNFEGVDSCFYVWLNGSFVGYSQVSHSTSEFDISKFIREGNNLLAVLVVKWCDGSYLEDQDKFRTTGIFRDVYLLKRPENHLWDYFITTENKEACSKVRIQLQPSGCMGAISIYIKNAIGEKVAGTESVPNADGEPYAVDLEIDNPILWNPEKPYLYTIIFETSNEVITDRIGLRSIYTVNNIVYLNDVPIKFRGVNRHDSDPFTGPVISIAHMKRDLQMIKAHNFNAIRTSHYPNAPMFYQLCDEYGFLVVDEADLEGHGVLGRYVPNDDQKERRKQLWNEPFADNPEYLDSIKDRVLLCVQRDKNRPCVVVWSAGNESGYGYCFEQVLGMVKEIDNTRLVHYEGAQYTNPIRKYDYSNLDLYSNMYASMEMLQEYVESNPDKPYLICEYSHAMGNGPGDLEDYWKMFQKYDCLCGGFVWEWCDHAVFAGYAENGKAKFLYGGDHNEYPHDGNFCMDGLVYPDRRPHTGLLEYKNVNRPLRVTAYNADEGCLELRNYMDFTEFSEYVFLEYEMSCDGEIVTQGIVEELPIIFPNQTGCVSLPIEVPTAGRCFLKINYRLKNDTCLLSKGSSLGFDEIVIPNQDGRNQTAVNLLSNRTLNLNPVRVSDDHRYITVSSNDFTYTYDKFTAAFQKMAYKGYELISEPIQYNIWRAPTDNDRKLKLHWFEARYDVTTTRAYETHYKELDDKIQICSKISISALGTQRMLDLSVLWQVATSGVVDVRVEAVRNCAYPELPRFGLRLFLPNDMESVSYYGLGPMENYIDKKQAAYHGLFETTVSKLHEDYTRPQENGAHCDCDYIVLSNQDYRVTVVGENRLCFTASHYTQEELTCKNHNFELIESGKTVLCIDYKQNGIGSNSCGPVLLDKYRFVDDHFEFSVRILPESV